MEYNTIKDQLIYRFDDNYADFKHTLRGVSRGKLFDMAGRIAAVQESFHTLTEEYAWDVQGEIDFFLMFRDPLTIVADAWEKREPTRDFDDVMYEILNDDGIISQYPLMEGSAADLIYIGEPAACYDRVLKYCEI